MNILIAPDSFKGTLTSGEVIETVKPVIRESFPDALIQEMIMGDGGEGTAEVLVRALNGKRAEKEVHSPIGKRVMAKYGIIDNCTVVLEMAEASGLTLVPPEERNPMQTSSVGTGELLKEVLDNGYENIYLTVGGSATNDGGMGAAHALGIRFIDANGSEIVPSGRNLEKVFDIDDSGIHPQLKKANIIILSDVKNKLIGPNGATCTFAAQKGATPSISTELEKGMKQYVKVIEKKCKKNIHDISGSGAGGGIAVPFLAFGNTTIRSGIDTILELTEFDRILDGIDLVITGEGRLDAQSAEGKVAMGIGQACQKKGVPVVVIAGTLGDGAEKINQYGVNAFVSTTNSIMEERDIYLNCKERLKMSMDQTLRLIKVGIGIGRKMK